MLESLLVTHSISIVHKRVTCVIPIAKVGIILGGETVRRRVPDKQGYRAGRQAGKAKMTL